MSDQIGAIDKICGALGRSLYHLESANSFASETGLGEVSAEIHGIVLRSTPSRPTSIRCVCRVIMPSTIQTARTTREMSQGVG
jgi:hypothetical protein